MRARLIVSVIAVVCACFASVASAQALDRAGDVWEISATSTSERAREGSSGSSNSGFTFVERVIAVRADGLELEFDLPSDASESTRSYNWQFPARVLRSTDGSLRLLNTEELAERNRAFLKDAGIPERACGHWVFTWTSIRIDCDPQSVVGVIEGYDLRAEAFADGVTPIDVDAVRRERAEMDIAVAEMTRGQPLSLDAALQAHASEQISGTVTTTFEADAEGRIASRTRIIVLEVVDEQGSRERTTTTQTMRRRLLTRGTPH